MPLIPKELMSHLYERGKNILEGLEKRVVMNLSEEADAILGMSGRLLSGSKSTYAIEHPDHNVYFNACIFDKDGVEIWFGDLDLTLDTDKLQQLANQVGKIYVTPEQPFRFEGLAAGRKSYNKGRIVEFKP